MKGALYFLGVGILFMVLGLVVPFFFAFGVMTLLFALFNSYTSFCLQEYGEVVMIGQIRLPKR